MHRVRPFADNTGIVKVPMLDLSAHHAPLRADLVKALARVVDHGQFVLGPEVEAFEKHLAEACGAESAIGVTSGTDALLVSLMALGLGPGDEVVTTPFSFFATAGVVARLGAKPVFADIDPVTFNIDPACVEKALTARTKAILPVHLYGQCADMDPIMRIAASRGIPVVEDACQAIGAEYKDGRRAGTIGAFGCLSFYPTKNLGALGDAGAVLTNDAELAGKVRLLRTHGAERRYFHKMIGGNFRLSALQAAALEVKLPYLSGWSAARRTNAQRYDALLQERKLVEKGLRLPYAAWKNSGRVNYHIYHQYVIRAPNRDLLREHLAKKEIASDVFYPLPFHLQECFASLGYKAGAFPESERAAQEVLALPIYPELTADQQEYVAGAIAAFY